MNLVERVPDARVEGALVKAGVPVLLSRLYAARGVVGIGDIDLQLEHLLSPELLKGGPEAAVLLADMIANKRRIVIVADYDCDGATACAVGVRGLTRFGADVRFIVPNRFEHGYGLTPEIVDLAI